MLPSGSMPRVLTIWFQKTILQNPGLALLLRHMKDLKTFIGKAILKAQKDKKLPIFDIPEIIIETPQNREFGDYSTSIAMRIAKITKINPHKVAGILVDYLRGDFDVEPLPPGFINFRIEKDELFDNLKEILKKKSKYGSKKDKRTMVIDYSAPNIAKPFGIGHLRSTIIGQAIYNIYAFLGWKCIGDNHLGDWGTQFGKLIVAVKKWNDKDINELSIEDLEKLYVKFHSEAEMDKSLVEDARQWFKKLEAKDEEATNIWKACINISIKEFDKVYKLLGVKIDETLGESFYEDKMQEVIEDAKDLAKESQGAQVIDVDGIDIPLMLLKSDGATTYETRDLATIKHRNKTWNPDLIIYEVGADQILHFRKIFKVAEMLGYKGDTQYKHIAHGLIRWKDRKFSTRKGDTIKLKDVLDEAINRAKEISDDDAIAEMIGIGAVKYNDLSRQPERDIVFDLDQMVTLTGNSGPYIQYTGVRCKSILKKNNKLKVKKQELNAEEEMLLRDLSRFPEIVQLAADKFSPNVVCNYVFELCQNFNTFYEKHSILTGDKIEIRLAITKGVEQIINNSLTLMGIGIPEQM